MIFEKTFHSIHDQVLLLSDRGLFIQNDEDTIRVLNSISYFRLSGYWWPMQSDKINHIFKPNSKFSDVVMLYHFDKELRMLLFDVIEQIEIALRTRMGYCFSECFSPWWFEDKSLFMSKKFFETNLLIIDKELSRTSEDFIKAHRKKYCDDKRRPPSWKTLEVLSFGTLSKLYKNFKPKHSVHLDQIANQFSLQTFEILQNWLESLSVLRNMCAHHARVWNKIYPGVIKLPDRMSSAWISDIPFNNKLYSRLCVVKYLLDSIDPQNEFKSRLLFLLNKYPHVDLNAMGFCANWETEALWMSL